jgi:hypothetical protein
MENYGKKALEYIDRVLGGHNMNVSEQKLSMHGHLKIECNGEIVFDDHNLIVSEGKGYVMDLLASLGVSYSYTPKPFNGIVLTSNVTAENANDTFKNAVYNQGVLDKISDEGVLHVGGIGGGQVALTHTQGGLTITAVGTIPQNAGNDPANNHINSVCLCAGLNDSYGGPGQGAYSATGDERIFSRVYVADLVKDVTKAYTFTWIITIQ